MGNLCLVLSWLLILISIFIGFFDTRFRSINSCFILIRSTTIASTLFLVAAIVLLGVSFVINDYSLQYVWQYSNREMDSIYKFTAIWGGMDGSMLLWCVMLAVSGGLVAYNSIVQSDKKLMIKTLATINTATFFFTTVTLFLSNPFRFIKAPFIPPDGNGLNPLLQNPYMAIHPPMLYLGFTTLAIPYAFCIGALWSNRGEAKDESPSWIELTKRWTLIGWTFLTIGIFLGGHWAYLELGWGGFWAWDPVENASFLPWLIATAFLHSIMVQEKKGLLKAWNVWLIVITYALTVLGTFLTRSGIVQSIHAFAETNIGWTFLVYLSLIILSTLYLTITRKELLKPEKSVVSFF